MKDLNKKYLRHNFATDVLTFDWSLNGKPAIDGEIIISSPTAKRQAREYGNSIQEEIMLYMIHGLLHLLGYDDHGLKQIKKMRTKENELLSIVK